MNIKADLKKRILSKIEEGYNEGGRLVEMGEVALYPDPAPSVDPTVQGSNKVLQVDSDLLRDLLNWATSADAGSIDAVVAKAEEMGMSSPLTPAQLVDLTATAHTADPSNPSVNACTQPDAAGITSPVVPAGPVGPLSPVMASFQRRGKKVDEAKFEGLAGDNGKDAAIQVGGKGQMPVKAAIALDKQVKGHQKRTGQKFDGTQDTLMGIGEDDVIDGVAHEPITAPKQMGKKNPGVVSPVAEGGDDTSARLKALKAEIARLEAKTKEITNGHAARMGKIGPVGTKKMKEDDIIASDHEVIVNPEEMGKKNPGIDADGGQTPTGLPIGDKKNKGNTGLSEDGFEDEVDGEEIEGGEVEDVAAAIADGLADGFVGDEIETEPEVNALPGEGIPQDDDDAAINAAMGEPVSPPVAGGEGLVGQIATLNARVAELEALVGGSETEEPEIGEVGAEVEIGDEEGEDDEDELSIDGDNAEDEGGEDDEDEDEEKDDSEEEDDESEEDDSEEDEDEDKKLLLGDEEEEKK